MGNNLDISLFLPPSFKDKYSLLYGTHPQALLVLWPCYVIIYVRWGICFDELAAVLQIIRGNRDNFGIIIHIYTVKNILWSIIRTVSLRTKHPPGQNTPCSFWHRWTKHPSCFLQGGHNTPCNLWKGGQNPPRKFCKVDKIPPSMCFVRGVFCPDTSNEK